MVGATQYLGVLLGNDALRVQEDPLVGGKWVACNRLISHMRAYLANVAAYSLSWAMLRALKHAQPSGRKAAALKMEPRNSVHLGQSSSM